MTLRKKSTRAYRKAGFHRYVCALLILPVLALCAFSGCGVEQNDSQAQTSPLSLDVWTFFDMNTPGDYYLTLWEDLADKYGYQVHVESFTTEQIKDKLEIALACRELPDIFLVWGGTYPDYLFDAGACIPLQDAIARAGFSFDPDYIEPYRDGNRYIIPCLVEAYAVTYYNRNLFDQLGLSVPTTWDELVHFVSDVQTYNIAHGTDYAPIELGDKDEWLGELLLCTVANRIDPSLFDRLTSGKTDLSDPAFADACSRIALLRDMQAFQPDYLETGEVEAVENFINGEALLFPHQSTIMYHLMQNMGEQAVGLTQFPSCNPVYDSSYTQYIMDINHTLTPGLCVSSTTRYPEQASELCLSFAQEVNRINEERYGYYNYTDIPLQPPAELPLPVRQFHDMLDNSLQTSPYLYALLDRKCANSWRSLTKQLYADNLTATEFATLGNRYLVFPERRDAPLPQNP